MNQIFIFAGIATLAGSLFLVSIIELVFTVRRRKAKEQILKTIKEMKVSYNQSVNTLMHEGEVKIQEQEKKVEEVHAQTEEEKQKISAEFQAEITEVKEKAEHALELAKKRAKKLENEAKMKAEEYLESRRDQVEKELMDLVMSVTKQVIPKGITYEVHKDLVAKALEEARMGGRSHE